MRVENLRLEQDKDCVRMAATVFWEDCPRPQQEVYFETTDEFAQGVWPNPHAFLLGCLLPAMHHGERRISLDGEVCPALEEGITYAMTMMRHWFYEPQRRLVRIEAKRACHPPKSRRAPRAGALFSGGIDSLALVRNNRLRYPREHPWSIEDALLLLGSNVESDMSAPTLKQAVADLSLVAADIGMRLIPVYTNIRSLEEDNKFFLRVNQSAILASAAHAFAHRLDTFFIAASDDVPALGLTKQTSFLPWGSHPLIDGYYSSAGLQIRHEPPALTRLDKVRVIAGWKAGLNHIKVCGRNWPGANCGRCEKCVRTMLELFIVGALAETQAFPRTELTAALIANARKKIRLHSVASWYMELVAPLREAGRDDLAQAVKLKIEEYQNHERKGWQKRIKYIGRRYFRRSLAKPRR